MSMARVRAAATRLEGATQATIVHAPLEPQVAVPAAPAMPTAPAVPAAASKLTDVPAH